MARYHDDYDRNEYDDRDRYREREDEGPFSRHPFERDRPRRERQYSEGADWRRQSSTRERNFDRDYGTGYEPGYGMSYQASYGNRYRDEGVDDDWGRGRESRNASRGSSLRYSRSSYTPDYSTDFDTYDRENRERRYSSRYDEGLDRGAGNRHWWDRMADEIASWFGDEEAEQRRRRDEAHMAQRASYKGKGPRGYKRSDERIQEDVSDRLTDYEYLDASDITVTVVSGVVTLGGNVSSQWARRAAEDVAETVSGVQDIQNNLRVGRNIPLTTPATSATTNTQTKSPEATKSRAKNA
jgi:osmotically-inducible protein OsmY